MAQYSTSTALLGEGSLLLPACPPAVAKFFACTRPRPTFTSSSLSSSPPFN